MKYYIIIILFSLSLSSRLFASENPVWHHGSIVSQNNEVLVGKVLLHLAFDLVLFKKDNNVFTYPAHKLQSLYYYDSAANINRKFISQINPTFDLHKPVLFEVVLQGEITLLRKFHLRKHDATNELEGYEYFTLLKNDVRKIRDFKDGVFPLMVTSSMSLEKFMKQNKLAPNNLEDIILITQFYNREFSNSTSVLLQ